MQFEDLATELVLHIFQSCTSIPDVLNLASTCHHFRKVFAASQRLPILYRAAEAQFGPLQDAIQLVTHNASQPAHLMRSAPSSSALLHQLLEVGRVAQKWEAIYPLTKWKHDFTSRRLLTAPERRLLRRAIYRLWLYSRAFHTPAYPRTARKRRANVLERAALLHNWSSPELAQIEDVRLVIRHVLQHHVCPSNGALRRSFRNRFPDDPQQQQLLFQGHRSCPPPPSAFREHFHSALQVAAAPGFVAAEKFRAAALQELGAEGWGDEIPHYYVVEDMLKLDPGQVVWLRENAPLKGMVEGFVRGLGGWFENNGETFGETLEWVVGERGGDVQRLREEIAAGGEGVVRREEGGVGLEGGGDVEEWDGGVG